MPAGADTVVIQEHDHARRRPRRRCKSDRQGPQCPRAGLDFSAGDVLLAAGHRLERARSRARRRHEPSAACRCIAGRRSRCSPPATNWCRRAATPGPGQIVYSNGFALAALARAEGAEVIDLGIVARPARRDRSPRSAARARLGADILVTTGGASVGEYDLVQKAFAAEGMALSFWKVALRPGRPLMHGRLGAMHVLGLPGNPVSSYVCAFLFLVPLMRRLAGRTRSGAPDRIGGARLRPAGQRRARRLSARHAGNRRRR